MSIYIIAGTSDNTMLTHWEAIGDILMTWTRNIKVFRIAKHPS